MTHTHRHQDNMDYLDSIDIQHRYDGATGTDYIAGEFFREKLLMASRFRKQIFKLAKGDILDVACGTGENFAHYNGHGTSYTAIELSPFMLEQASKRADKLDMDVKLRLMNAQNLDFDTDSFDTVVSALSTCTFPDATAALQEMQRVCKPDGRILLFEHGRSTCGPIARWQDRTAPHMYESAGCRANQDPIAVVKEAGLHILSAKARLFNIFHLIEIVPQ